MRAPAASRQLRTQKAPAPPKRAGTGASRELDRDNGSWSWGESNPRPTLGLRVFSGRSLCRRSARLRPLSQTPKSTSPAWEKSRVTSRRRHAARPLNDARIRGGVTHGLTDYRARLRSEGEVSALSIGTYCFAGSVYEITPHPRPASRGFAGAVETDQPRELRNGAAVVTLLSCHAGAIGTRASQSTTLRAPRNSPAPADRVTRARHRRIRPRRPTNGILARPPGATAASVLRCARGTRNRWARRGGDSAMAPRAQRRSPATPPPLP